MRYLVIALLLSAPAFAGPVTYISCAKPVAAPIRVSDYQTKNHGIDLNVIARVVASRLENPGFATKSRTVTKPSWGSCGEMLGGGVIGVVGLSAVTVGVVLEAALDEPVQLVIKVGWGVAGAGAVTTADGFRQMFSKTVQFGYLNGSSLLPQVEVSGVGLLSVGKLANAVRDELMDYNVKYGFEEVELAPNVASAKAIALHYHKMFQSIPPADVKNEWKDWDQKMVFLASMPAEFSDDYKLWAGSFSSRGDSSFSAATVKEFNELFELQATMN